MFGSFASAVRCCADFAEQRQYYRAQAHLSERISLTERRRRFQARGAAVSAALVAA